MFTFLDSFSYCCSGNPFQLDTSAQVSNPGSGMHCGEVTLSGPCSLISMVHLHRQFIIIILLMKLEFHCLQIRSQHLKKKGKRRKINANPVPPSPHSSCLAPPAITQCPCRGAALAMGWGLWGFKGAPGPAQHRPSLPSPTLQTTAALGQLGQLNCLVKYKWAADFLKLGECGKPLGRG